MSAPMVLRFMGKLYRRVEAALPAHGAEKKLEQIDRALSRVESQGYPYTLVPSIVKQWRIDEDDLLASVDRHGDHPLLIMWNPITTELLLSSPADMKIAFHTDLHHRNKGSLEEYNDAGYDDWVRAFLEDGSNIVKMYKWEPMARYSAYLSGAKLSRYIKEKQAEGMNAFKKMLQRHGATSYQFGLTG